jgi:hypothetical protein
MQDGPNKVNAVKIKEIYDMSWPPNFDSYRELVLSGMEDFRIERTVYRMIFLKEDNITEITAL